MHWCLRNVSLSLSVSTLKTDAAGFPDKSLNNTRQHGVTTDIFSSTLQIECFPRRYEVFKSHASVSNLFSQRFSHWKFFNGFYARGYTCEDTHALISHAHAQPRARSVWFVTSAAMWMRPALVWEIWRRLVVPFRHFEKIYYYLLYLLTYLLTYFSYLYIYFTYFTYLPYLLTLLTLFYLFTLLT
jgi:hypothetical protein